MKIFFKAMSWISLLLFPVLSYGNTPLSSDALQKVKTLSLVVARCIERHDTAHPVFHGCVDWHSAVHGHWSLIQAAHFLGDSHMSRRVLGQMTNDGLKRELAQFKRFDEVDVDFEMPYGRAWYLQLAADVERLHGDSTAASLRPLADYLYATLLDFARSAGGDVTAPDYRNASWYLFQLYQWAEFNNYVEDKRLLIEIIEQRFNKDITWPKQGEIRGFFDPLMMAVLLLSTVEPLRAVYRQIRRKIDKHVLSVLDFPFRTAHQGGLNFSRSWGIARLVCIEAEPRYTSALNRFRAAMANSFPLWSADYGRYGHWVAQFGIFSYWIESECNVENVS